MLKVRFRFGTEIATLGSDMDQWNHTIFVHRQTETPNLVVQIQFADGHKLRTRICDLVIVEAQ